jgi:ABC-type ATPase involved in cell division
MPALSIAGLTKSFRAGTDTCSARVSVLRELDCALWPGEIVALEGAPGVGKSTLLRCAAGVLRPDSGAIVWGGSRAPARERVAYVESRVVSRVGADGRIPDGALYTSLERAVARSPGLILVDDLAAIGALECRLALRLLRARAAAGAAILMAANEEIASEPSVTRVVTLAHGELVQRRKRSATRIAASSFASRARASASSTYGRSLRSPQ